MLMANLKVEIMINDADLKVEIMIYNMVNLKVEEEVVKKLAPFKPVPPARPPHLARTL